MNIKIFYGIDGLLYKCHKISLNCGGVGCLR